MFKTSIRASILLSTILVSGCAPSNQALIDEAQLTGDWTLVNKREDAIDRREAEQPPSCRRGTRAWCEKRGSAERCGCIEDGEFRGRLNSLLR